VKGVVLSQFICGKTVFAVEPELSPNNWVAIVSAAAGGGRNLCVGRPNNHKHQQTNDWTWRELLFVIIRSCRGALGYIHAGAILIRRCRAQ